MEECINFTYFDNRRFHVMSINKPLAEEHDDIEFVWYFVQDVARCVGKRCIFMG